MDFSSVITSVKLGKRLRQRSASTKLGDGVTLSYREICAIKRRLRHKRFGKFYIRHYGYTWSQNWVDKEEGVIVLGEKKKGSKLETNILANEIREFISQEYFLAKIKADKSVYSSTGSRMVPTGIEVNSLMAQYFEKYWMVSSGEMSCAGFKGKDGLIDVFCAFSVNSKNLYFEIFGDKSDVDFVEKEFINPNFSYNQISVNWTFVGDQGMQSYELPLSTPDPIEHAYPWLEESVGSFTDRFMKSRASIMILIGPPGTGKTTLLKEILTHSRSSAMLTYDTKLLFTDQFFASFMTNSGANFLILEDADNMMGSRKEGNDMMHKFLNASDGMVSLSHKKIIFTTNLPSIKDVDSALIRKGRCFQVVHSRALNVEESQKVAVEFFGKELPLTKPSYTLAEICNFQEGKDAEDEGRTVKSRFGF